MGAKLNANIEAILDAVIRAEGGSKVTNDPTDSGGRTQYGISERSHPAAWIDDKVTEEEAREIYRAKYVVGPHFDQIDDKQLQHLLVDWGVNSGPSIAIKNLQRAIGVEDDGVIGPATLSAIAGYADQRALTNKLVADRIRMIIRIVQRDKSQLRYLGGWTERTLSFII